MPDGRGGDLRQLGVWDEGDFVSGAGVIVFLGVMAGGCFQVLDEGAAVINIEDLEAAADAEDGKIAFNGFVD